MIFGAFLLLVALSISAVAAFYSIAGLTAIFAAAVVPIIIMGAVLETGKIAATVWLHRYWDQAALQFKLYLIPAILILMLITSMGIFGFLSKAHLDQTAPTGDIAAQVEIIDEKINTERDNIQTQRDNIESAKLALTQLDIQVTEMLGRTTSERGANRAVQIRRQQAKERAVLQKEIAQAQTEIESINTKIALLNEERAPLASEVRKIEAEVGPIKYIAALIYGDNPDANLLERSVRWVIILLVLVFDPLALVLILAAEQTFVWARQERSKRKDWHQEWVPNSKDPWHNEPKYELDDGPLTDKQMEEIKAQSGIDQELEMREEYDFSNATRGPILDKETQEFFDRGKELARTIDTNNGNLPENYANTQSYLQKPWVWMPASSNGLVITSDADEKFDAGDYLEYLDEKSLDLKETTTEQDSNVVIEIPDPDFGERFPDEPVKGQQFLRIDYLPSKLFKWNGNKWIEVDKIISDQYVDNKQYINYLVQKIRSREYTLDDLTDAEKDEVLNHLTYQEKTRLL